MSAGQLLDKVDKLKDKIDAGELDGQSNLGNVLDSTYTENGPGAFKIGNQVSPEK